MDPDKLPEVFPPFLPKLTAEQKAADTFTLVLDLDETLVHYFEVRLFHSDSRIRPFSGPSRCRKVSPRNEQNL